MRAISSFLMYTVSAADLHLPLLCHRGLHMLCFHCHWTIQVSVCVLTQFSFSRNFFSFEELPDNCGEGRWQPPLTWKPCVCLPGKKWTALFQALECTDLRNNLHKSPEMTKESNVEPGSPWGLLTFSSGMPGRSQWPTGEIRIGRWLWGIDSCLCFWKAC